MSAIPKYSIELLAPARDASVAIAAINHGADAVYIGAPSHGARAAASNSIADIARVCDYAHGFDARVYVTVNTLVYESELRDVERLVADLYGVGVDALIVQDLALLRLDLPPIALHASTQCDIRTPERARFLQDLGFSQLVLPRELTLDEIRAVRAATSVPLEAFVHGALCVSYSGDCRASLMCGGRSANRGECAQICRLPFSLADADAGRILIENKHLLSLRDLNRLDALADMISAGISSLKIEGRLKDEAYVKNVVSAYDQALRALGVARASRGTVDRTFTPDLSRTFNRGYTSHFLRTSMPAPGALAAFESPKSLGLPVAVVKSVSGRRIELKNLREPLANGDGLNFTTGAGAVCGFRVNRFQPPATVFTADAVANLRPGATLRRSFDKAFADALAPADTAVRTIPLDLTLRQAGGVIVLETDDGTAATIPADGLAPARTPQLDARRNLLGRLGDTVYRLRSLADLVGPDIFIAPSALAQLRRALVEMLDAGARARFSRPLRAPERTEAAWPEGASLTFHANVANSLAESLYRAHGVSGTIQPALETSRPDTTDGLTVMTTRYCLRRELGACLRDLSTAKKLPANLLLLSQNLPALRLAFDCRNCQMNIQLTSK